ncbi:MAG TPA: methyltransferase domain-containing protein [Gemmatimonadaceae bacterium]|nr:methyltransferase domain-containing protein [Gemmatimonadaceae bacterium]
MTSSIAATPSVDVEQLRTKVQDMYRQVAREPQGHFHFEMGRALAERLGYPPGDLDAIPAESIESFAGVGHHFDLAALREGETVLDLGSGSGMDTFVAARRVGARGAVIGVDMTDAQLQKAEMLRDRAGLGQVTYRTAYLESLPLPDDSVDVVISNGVINLCADKAGVFREAARVLRPGGRLAISDIVTERDLPETVSCDATLWAACIGGAMRQDRYIAAIEAAGLRVTAVQENPAYRFLSRSAQGASREYGVRSVSLRAEKV